MRILLVEPYFAGSHRAWAEGYRRFSRHDVLIVSHDARFWKWRMQGGFVTLAEAAERAVAEHGPPDVVLASDMLHLPAFLGLVRRTLGNVPAVLYLHENQLTYPLSPRDSVDLSYALANWTSLVAADRIFFNSEYHRRDLFEALPGLLRRFPDYRHLHLLDEVMARAGVLPVGIDLRRLDGARIDEGEPPLVLWNQRWEHDKDPASFFAALDELDIAGIEFRLALAGENFRNEPGEFDAAQERYGSRVVHFGYADDETYVELLRRATVTVSTALHEFFGIAVVEAIYAGVFPVLPHRLVYPERIPADLHEQCLYRTAGGLVDRLRWAVQHPEEAARIAVGLRPAVAGFDWSVVAPHYDAELESIAAGT